METIHCVLSCMKHNYSLPNFEIIRCDVTSGRLCTSLRVTINRMFLAAISYTAQILRFLVWSPEVTSGQISKLDRVYSKNLVYSFCVFPQKTHFLICYFLCVWEFWGLLRSACFHRTMKIVFSIFSSAMHEMLEWFSITPVLLQRNSLPCMFPQQMLPGMIHLKSRIMQDYKLDDYDTGTAWSCLFPHGTWSLPWSAMIWKIVF